MLPTSDQIQRAAYHIWLGRDQVHGRDRQDWLEAERELTFRLNYRTIVEFVLDPSTPKVLGDRLTRHCRLCERAWRMSISAALGRRCPAWPANARF